MTRLLLVKDRRGDDLWVAALIDEDLWTYVANTGKFHLNEGLRHDYFFLNELQYSDISLSEAERLTAAGVGHVDEEEFPESAAEWREDRNPLTPEAVYAKITAGNA